MKSPTEAAAVMRKWRAANPERNRAISLSSKRRQRGLPAPTRAESGACECCGVARIGATFSLDHDHATGAFRGWLCAKCNTGIGLLGDNLAGLLRAVDYILRNS